MARLILVGKIQVGIVMKFIMDYLKLIIGE